MITFYLAGQEYSLLFVEPVYGCILPTQHNCFIGLYPSEVATMFSFISVHTFMSFRHFQHSVTFFFSFIYFFVISCTVFFPPFLEVSIRFGKTVVSHLHYLLSDIFFPFSNSFVYFIFFLLLFFYFLLLCVGGGGVLLSNFCMVVFYSNVKLYLCNFKIG